MSGCNGIIHEKDETNEEFQINSTLPLLWGNINLRRVRNMGTKPHTWKKKTIEMGVSWIVSKFLEYLPAGNETLIFGVFPY